MNKNPFISRLLSVSLLLMFGSGVSHAMPGMQDSSGVAATERPRVSKSIVGKINTSGAEMEITYSADGKTAIFVSTRAGSVQSPGVDYSFDIWMSQQVNGEWQEPIHLGAGIDPKVGPKINSAQRDHMHWTGLSKDGKSLIITSMRTDLGSRGGHDEWISQQNADGEWQEPVNLGDTINTGGEDMCWTFTPDGKKFTGSWGPHGTFDMDIRWVDKNDVPLLKDFEPIGPPPNLLSTSTKKSVTDQAVKR